jgi:hypothetical protein
LQRCVGRRRHFHEDRCAIGVAPVHAIQHQAVQVDVEVGRRPEALAAFAFEETGRDEWSVYLIDRSRGVNVQLDLPTRKVMYSDARSPRRALYDIAEASGGSVTAALPMAAPAPAVAPPPPPPPPPPVVVNGRNVRKVQAGQGGAVKSVFVHASPGRWNETDAAGKPRFGFEESGRDEWSVYLLDRSRGVSIQLDLHTRKVMYRDGNKPMQPLYDVLGATHSP